MQGRTGRLQELRGTVGRTVTTTSHAGSFRCRYRMNSMRTGNGAKRNGTSQSQTFLARTRAWSIIHTKTQMTRPVEFKVIQRVVWIFRLLEAALGLWVRNHASKIAKAASNPMTIG